MTLRHLFLLFVLALALPACGGTETGNPSATASLGLTAYSSDPDVEVGETTTAAGLQVTAAWLKVGELFVTECAGQSPVAPTTGFTLDLVSGSGAPEVTLPASFCGLRLIPDASVAVGADVPMELTDAELMIEGVRADQSPFVITSAGLSTVTLAAPTAISSKDHPALLLSFDVSVWLAPIDIDAVPLDTHNTARLDGVAHPITVTSLDAQFAVGITLYDDLDQDQVLDSDERSTPVATSH